MKKILPILLLILPLCLFAQQWLQFSQINNYGLFQNPSQAGINKEIDIYAAHRSQYVGLSPKSISSQNLGFSMPVASPKLGLGLKIVNDVLGFQRYTAVGVDAAYHLSFGKSQLSVGGEVGLINYSLDGTKLRAADGQYSNTGVFHSDNDIPNIQISASDFTTSAGLHYRIQNFDIGVAVNNINNPTIKASSTDFETKILIGRTINIYSSYVIEVGKVELKPSIMMKSDLKVYQMQSSFLVDFSKVYVGAAYRGFSSQSNDALIGQFGFRIKQNISVGYSYDYNVSALNNFNTGSHELSLRYVLPVSFTSKSRGNTWYTPRFM